MRPSSPWISISLFALLTATTLHAEPIANFKPSSHFNEQTLDLAPDDGVRVLLNAPGDFDPTRPSHLVLFALPNGNTIEQTMGCVTTPLMDWHFDIQHVAAQTRLLRKLNPNENLVVAAIEANTKSWPAWRKARPDNPARIRKIVDAIMAAVPGKPVHITLTCHSGGGSFLFGYIDGGDAIPPNVTRIAWLDANYGYDDPEKHHGDKLRAWLKSEAKPTLVVIAYDDRNITLNGKKVVSDTGGTYRASHRMIDRFKTEVALEQSAPGDFDQFVGMNGQITFMIHRNPEVKILHTVLVERNGLIEALTLNTPMQEKWDGKFWGDRAYRQYIQPAPATQPAASTKATGIPPRPADAPGGKAFAESIDDLPPNAREAAVVKEMLRGNIPNFLRMLQPVTLKRNGRTVVLDVMPDYLAVGSDEDFLRIPMTPRSATMIADTFGFSLPTVKIVDAIYESAEIKLEPRPLTQERESTRTFGQHNAIIEDQLAQASSGTTKLSLETIVAGTKKDVVITNALKLKPNKVAIYGWHKLDGKPIQPLYTGHVDWYVDYSHGIRLVSREVLVDGSANDLLNLLADPKTCALLGEDEPVTHPIATYHNDPR
jgi:hypothetical protein